VGPKSAAEMRRHAGADRQLVQLGAQTAATKGGGFRGSRGPRQLGAAAAAQECRRPRVGVSDFPQHPGHGGVFQASAKRRGGRREDGHRRRRAKAVHVDHSSGGEAHSGGNQRP